MASSSTILRLLRLCLAYGMVLVSDNDFFGYQQTLSNANYLNLNFRNDYHAWLLYKKNGKSERSKKTQLVLLGAWKK